LKKGARCSDAPAPVHCAAGAGQRQGARRMLGVPIKLQVSARGSSGGRPHLDLALPDAGPVGHAELGHTRQNIAPAGVWAAACAWHRRTQRRANCRHMRHNVWGHACSAVRTCVEGDQGQGERYPERPDPSACIPCKAFVRDRTRAMTLGIAGDRRGWERGRARRKERPRASGAEEGAETRAQRGAQRQGRAQRQDRLLQFARPWGFLAHRP